MSCAYLPPRSPELRDHLPLQYYYYYYDANRQPWSRHKFFEERNRDPAASLSLYLTTDTSCLWAPRAVENTYSRSTGSTVASTNRTRPRPRRAAYLVVGWYRPGARTFLPGVGKSWVRVGVLLDRCAPITKRFSKCFMNYFANVRRLDVRNSLEELMRKGVSFLWGELIILFLISV